MWRLSQYLRDFYIFLICNHIDAVNFCSPIFIKQFFNHIFKMLHRHLASLHPGNIYRYFQTWNKTAHESFFSAVSEFSHQVSEYSFRCRSLIPFFFCLVGQFINLLYTHRKPKINKDSSIARGSRRFFCVCAAPHISTRVSGHSPVTNRLFEIFTSRTFIQL